MHCVLHVCTHTKLLEVRKRTVLEAVGNARAADGLLADARNHLRDVDERALGAAYGHDQRTVVSIECLETRVAGLVSNHRQLFQNKTLFSISTHKCIFRLNRFSSIR